MSASGLYSWLKSYQQHRHGVVHTDEFILTAVKGFIKQSRGYTPGLMSCYRHLRKQGLSIDYKRLRRIMRDNGLYHRYHRKYVKTTDSEHQLSCARTCLIVALMTLASMKPGAVTSPTFRPSKGGFI